MPNTSQKYGIAGLKAPELSINQWVDKNGEKSAAITLANLKGQFKVIYCFQAWCPCCHSIGLPALQKMISALAGKKKIAFLAIQTVFEGAHENTFDRMVDIQKEYNLAIPFGHDEGNTSTRNIIRLWTEFISIRTIYEVATESLLYIVKINIWTLDKTAFSA